MAIRLSASVQTKLNDKHGGVTLEEIKECFANRDGEYLYDTRPEHLTSPITRWFISETNKGRKLKICFLHTGGDTFIKTAFEPNQTEIKLYEDKQP